MRGDGEIFFGDGTSEFVGLVDEGADRTTSGTAAKTSGGGFAVSVASLCVFALTRRSLRLGGLRKATMGGSGKMFLRRSDMCKRCMLALSIRLSVLRLGWYIVTNDTLSVFPFCLYVSRLVRSRSFALFIWSLIYVGLYPRSVRWCVRLLNKCVVSFGRGINAADADGLAVWNTLECVWGVA